MLLSLTFKYGLIELLSIVLSDSIAGKKRKQAIKEAQDRFEARKKKQKTRAHALSQMPSSRQERRFHVILEERGPLRWGPYLRSTEHLNLNDLLVRKGNHNTWTQVFTQILFTLKYF